MELPPLKLATLQEKTLATLSEPLTALGPGAGVGCQMRMAAASATKLIAKYAPKPAVVQLQPTRQPADTARQHVGCRYPWRQSETSWRSVHRGDSRETAPGQRIRWRGHGQDDLE